MSTTVPAPGIRAPGTRTRAGVRIERVTTLLQRRTYTLLPYRLHRHDPAWVPPLRLDEWRTYSRRNLALRYCDFARWLARDAHGRVIGRIAAIINRRYNTLRGESNARFAELECPEDDDVASGLLDTACDWARERGMSAVIGPRGFTDQDPEGFQVDGFAERTSIAMYQNPPWLPPMLDRLGWTKYADYVVYRVPVPATLPRGYLLVQRRLQRNSPYTLLEFERRPELKPLVRPILRLMNECFTEIEGFAPLEDDEIDDLARRFMPVIDPRFVKAVRDERGLCGFVIALPDMTGGLRRSRGRLLPLGWWWLLQAPKRARRLDLLLGGVRPDCRTRGVDVLMAAAMMTSARDAGFEYLDSHHELETNRGVRGEMEQMNGVVYKRFRLYRREV